MGSVGGDAGREGNGKNAGTTMRVLREKREGAMWRNDSLNFERKVRCEWIKRRGWRNPKTQAEKIRK